MAEDRLDHTGEFLSVLVRRYRGCYSYHDELKRHLVV
jgi:hypothetical protein